MYIFWLLIRTSGSYQADYSQLPRLLLATLQFFFKKRQSKKTIN